jgi:DNA-binding response OmpR family regulator
MASPLIALADDSAELRGLLAAALEIVGYRVVQAATGEDLLGTVRRLVADGVAVDLIITDVRMPTLGGLDAARRLREAGDATPLIFLTAFGDAWTRSQATELGAILLDKPLSITVLRHAVRLALVP